MPEVEQLRSKIAFTFAVFEEETKEAVFINQLDLVYEPVQKGPYRLGKYRTYSYRDNNRVYLIEREKNGLQRRFSVACRSDVCTNKPGQSQRTALLTVLMLCVSCLSLWFYFKRYFLSETDLL